ncbi:hypothetical protein KQI77_02525 [Clostridium sp. MSJ-8]|uniref:hypothetical protein n=1 Tax=Clostridium sp. MSJ-8 TaxID=2841510 RepID=UPI001C0EC6D3|nr:hypothetical protein [Clostridium sp. MSJ-8]MBU5487037.1 hypothetical protein [Clostridium sp. MSJ-8]
MQCPKCGSNNVNVQAVSIVKNKHHGVIYWLCFGWFIDLMLWVFLTIPKLIVAIFKPKKVKTKVKSFAVCQNCGHKWKV